MADPTIPVLISHIHLRQNWTDVPVVQYGTSVYQDATIRFRVSVSASISRMHLRQQVVPSPPDQPLQGFGV